MFDCNFGKSSTVPVLLPKKRIRLRRLSSLRAGQYWRLENLNSFDEFLARRFRESRRKACYLTGFGGLRALQTKLGTSSTSNRTAWYWPVAIWLDALPASIPLGERLPNWMMRDSSSPSSSLSSSAQSTF
jgi:hypothetical protein